MVVLAVAQVKCLRGACSLTGRKCVQFWLFSGFPGSGHVVGCAGLGVLDSRVLGWGEATGHQHPISCAAAGAAR